MRTGQHPFPLLVLGCALAALAGLVQAEARADGATVGILPLHQRPPGTVRRDPGPSPVIFPAQKLNLRFSHRRHVEKEGLACLRCHARAATSRRAADRILPSPMRCDQCHHTDHSRLPDVQAARTGPESRCDYCHLSHRPDGGTRVARTLIPTPRMRFDHAAHYARNIGCQQCHGNVGQVERVTRDQMPRMRGCYRCHQMTGPARGDASKECSTCHLTDRGNRLKTRFGSGELLPPRWMGDAGHDPDWIERHKQVAGNPGGLCKNCHTEQSCTDCHDGRVRPRRVHSNDWLSIHAVAGKQDNPRCANCHRYQSFCVTCHQRSGVSQTGPYANYVSRGRLHPPKSVWTDPPRSPRHHSWEAQRRLGSCVSCHVERDCTTCHATAARGGPGAGPGSGFGQGTNPHGRGFRSRCRTAMQKNPRPCLVCHAASDPKLVTCR